MFVQQIQRERAEIVLPDHAAQAHIVASPRRGSA